MTDLITGMATWFGVCRSVIDGRERAGGLANRWPVAGAQSKPNVSIELPAATVTY